MERVQNVWKKHCGNVLQLGHYVYTILTKVRPRRSVEESSESSFCSSRQMARVMSHMRCDIIICSSSLTHI